MGNRADLSANLIGKGLQVGLAAIAVPVYANLLGSEAYGVLGFLSLLLGLFVWLNLGLPALANRLVAHREMDAESVSRRAYGILWIVGGTAAAALVIAGPSIVNRWLNGSMLDPSTVATVVRIYAIPLLLSFPVSLRIAVLQGRQDHVQVNLVLGAAAIVQQAGGMLALLLLGPHLQVLAVWQACAAIAQFAAFEAVWRREPVTGAPLAASASLRPHMRFCAGITLAAITAALSLQADRLFASALLPLAGFAHYAVAVTMTSAAGLALGPLSATLFPLLCQAIAQDDQALTLHRYRQLTWLASLVLVPVSTTLVFFSHPISSLLFRDPLSAGDVGSLCKPLAVAALFGGLAMVPYQIQLARGMIGWVVRVNVVLLLLGASLCWLIVPRWGAIGCACVGVATGIVNLLCHLVFIRIHWPAGGSLTRFARDALVPAVPCCGASAILYVLWQWTGNGHWAGAVFATLSFVVAGAIIAWPGRKRFGLALSSGNNQGTDGSTP